MMGHKDLEEKDCLKCHDAGKGLPVVKCLDCHDEIKPFIEQKKGFHGLTDKSCIACHGDHKGRDFDSTVVDEKTFDHNLTGYKLAGEHAKIKCADCHKEKRRRKAVRAGDIRYLGAQSSCISCHKKDDIHAFKGEWKKKDCNQCHGVETWKKDIKFDHEKDTQFGLVGRHAELKCAECHIVNKAKKISRYEWHGLKQKQCLSCHQDVHKNNLSKKFQNGNCLSCHDQKTWKIEKFDHSVTKYPLRGRHAELKCMDCHQQTPATQKKSVRHFRWVGLNKNCLSCHDDFHAFAKHKVSKKKTKLSDCLSCHNEARWKDVQNFDHSKDTRYPVDGQHSTLKCNECHRPVKIATVKKRKIATERRYHWQYLNSKTCENCHQSPHTKTFSKEFLKKRCTECHVTSSWRDQPGKAGQFNHDDTRFKLTGRHNEISCRECHVQNKKQVFKFASDKKDFCIDCHKNPHREQFHAQVSEQACSACHTTRSFDRIKDFDHGQTRFAIQGQHKELKCADCHTPAKKEASKGGRIVTWHKYVFPDLAAKSCNTCHQDYHKGQLSLQCQTCHTENSWKKTKFNHNQHSDFALRGSHRQLKCGECHKPKPGQSVEFAKKKYRVIHYKPMNSNCIACHRKDDQHKGEFGQRCNECHTEKSWELTKDFHRNFTLHGVHYTLKCSECHINERRLGGMSENCMLCHQKDDVHSGTLPSCKECHSQHFWENTSFRHSRTLFPLRGSHRSVDCFSCHTQGIYQGTPSECVSCHMQDALSVGAPAHTMPAFQDCKSCHNQFSF